MKTPPELSRDARDDSLLVRLEVTEDLDCFRGHFPGLPVLPGVVQLHWAVEIARDYFGFPEVVGDIKRLKFKNVVMPPMVMELEVTRTGQDEARFEFSNSGATYSQGRLVFSGPAK